MRKEAEKNPGESGGDQTGKGQGGLGAPWGQEPGARRGNRDRRRGGGGGAKGSLGPDETAVPVPALFGWRRRRERGRGGGRRETACRLESAGEGWGPS